MEYEFRVKIIDKNDNKIEINCDKLGAVDIYNQIVNCTNFIIIGNSIIMKNSISQLLLYRENIIYEWRRLGI